MNTSVQPKRRMRRILLGVAVSLVTLLGLSAIGHNRYFSGTAYTPVPWTLGADIPTDLQAALDADLVANPHLYAGSLHVLAPGLGLDISVASGSANPATGDPMTPAHALRIASITKSYVAATALRLSEQGDLDLTTPLSQAISAQHNQFLMDDGYDTTSIQIGDLLDHRSGIADYASLDLYTLQQVLGDLRGRSPVWTRTSQIAFAMQHADPHWPTGGGFAYSDTGYILLGEAIERATGHPLPDAVRKALDFERLGLDSTWWEALEPAPQDAPRAHQFSGKADTTDLDASIDLFGGGGLMATPRDIAVAMRAIVRGTVFDSLATRDAMQQVVDNQGYAQGLARYQVTDQHLCWGHSGYWGLLALHCPEADITIALSYSQANVSAIGPRIGAIFRSLISRQDAAD